MYEVEASAYRINVDHDAYMAYGAARTRTGGEHQVAYLQLVLVNRVALLEVIQMGNLLKGT